MYTAQQQRAKNARAMNRQFNARQAATKRERIEASHRHYLRSKQGQS